MVVGVTVGVYVGVSVTMIGVLIGNDVVPGINVGFGGITFVGWG